ncbi:hypothetical protein RchiOBHm_Chr6g0275611 [Rosa chinensis]|uniref:Uncharacterized protein n=1 Tax=Rosa chinensis TaxID=74649 RepID=A0A2P6PS41_ROSCH|nr:hypothetical protein RchiOBHm_Chr6g0275611 [Rosa chinensis]
MDAINGSADKNVSQACPVVMRPSSSSPQGIGNSRSDFFPVCCGLRKRERGTQKGKKKNLTLRVF